MNIVVQGFAALRCKCQPIVDVSIPMQSCILSLTLIFGLCVQPALIADEPTRRPELKFIGNGKAIILEPEIQEKVILQVEAVYKTCNLNSDRHSFLKQDDPESIWKQVTSGLHILLKYPTPVTLGEHTILEIVQGFPTDFPTQPIARNGEHIIFHAKCDGFEMIKLMCLEGFAQYLPGGYARSCNVLREIELKAD